MKKLNLKHKNKVPTSNNNYPQQSNQMNPPNYNPNYQQPNINPNSTNNYYSQNQSLDPNYQQTPYPQQSNQMNPPDYNPNYQQPNINPNSANNYYSQNQSLDPNYQQTPYPQQSNQMNPPDYNPNYQQPNINPNSANNYYSQNQSLDPNYQQPTYPQQYNQINPPAYNSQSSYNRPINNSTSTPKKGLWIFKLVVGILMIILSFFIFLQGTLMGIGNSIANNHHTSGIGGIFVALIYLTAGIVYLSTKKLKSLGGDITNCVLLIVAWLFAITNADKTFTDLPIWGWLALIIGLGFLIWHIFSNRNHNF